MEKIVAPRASPDPLCIAYSQKAFAMTYEVIEHIQNHGLLLSDHSFARTSAMISKTISSERGISHMNVFM
jgi:hypothetical protein